MRYIKEKQYLNKEDGSVTVLALLLLALLTLLGIAVITTSSIEVQISGNDDRHKKALYEADGGTEVGFEMLEENIACPNGFNFTGSMDIGDVTVFTKAFWLIENEPTSDYPSDTVRDIRINRTAGSRTNLSIYGSTQLSTGNAIQMVAGYEGKGKGVGSGGAYLMYNVYSEHMGRDNSQAMIMSQWRHMIGQEGACNY
ncbi:MAG: PilX N-terminal domain-containing pilus assembly protein [Desulfobacterales bacterium]|jgi:Tfp pilus assembly protein PilX